MSGNVFDIFTGEIVEAAEAACDVRDDVSQLLKVIEQRKGRFTDVMVIWKEVDYADPMVISTPLHIIDALAMLEYTKMTFSRAHGVDEDEYDE